MEVAAQLESVAEDVSLLINQFDIPEQQRYGFKVGDTGFIYPAELAGEVLSNTRISPIPYTADWVLGIINLRGSLIPVYDLNRLFYSRRTDKPRILVIDQGKRAVAVCIKDYPQFIVKLTNIDNDAANAKESALPEPVKPFVTGCYQGESGTWFELDKHAFFSSLSSRFLGGEPG